MVNITKFNKPHLVVNAPKETQEFFELFEGNNLFITISKSGHIAPYYRPTNEVLKLISNSNGAGHDVFFCVNETRGAKRTKKDISKIRAIWADDDVVRAEPRTDFPLPPSIVLQSSPGKYHYYWLTTTTDRDEWERVNKGVAAFYDTDLNATDISRIMRVPGYLNNKYDPAVSSELLSSSGQRYEWATIVSAFPPIAKEKIREIEGKHENGEFNETELRKRFIAHGAADITGCGNSLIAHWRHHYSRAKTKQKIQELLDTVDFEQLDDSAAKRYYAFQSQVDKFINSIDAKLQAKRSVQSQKVAQLHPEVPESLDWDWSILKSNPIPEEAIPKTMLEAAKEVGEWTATGQDPAILSAVFITSALLSKNVLIHEIGDNLTTHCQSGICIVMDTGARKSSIYNQMNKPFFDYEDRLREEWEENRFVNESMVKALEMQIGKLDKNYAKQDSPAAGETLSYATVRGGLLNELDKIQVKQPWLRSADVTEEKLVRKLYDNQGCMAVISDDARQVINNIAGKYGKDGNTGESVYINALTGSAILYERVGSDAEMAIAHPVLNALLFVQPDAALKLRNSDMFVPSGLAARLPMYFYPVSGADIVKNTSRRPINENKMINYYNALQNICVRRIDNPLHIRLDEAGMAACGRMDQKFAELLETTWRGHYDKSNKLITLTTMYATCFAALEDPQFAMSFKDKQIEDNSYLLPVKYLNMGFMFAMALFGQSITSHQMIAYEALPRKAESFLSTLQKWYAEEKVREGFVQCGAFSNSFSPTVREFIPEIVDMLIQKKWLYTTIMEEETRKLNNGFPDKLVHTGDLIYHLNLAGIKKRDDLGLDKLEKAMLHKGDK